MRTSPRWLGRRARLLAAALTLVGCGPKSAPAQAPPAARPEPEAAAAPAPARVLLSREQAKADLCTLFETRDLDCDRRLTELDERARCSSWPCASQPPAQLGERSLALSGLHQASQLATELADGLLRQNTTVEVDLGAVLDDPVSYLERRIRTRYWRALTRTIAPGGSALWQALGDEKQGQLPAQQPDWCERPQRCAVDARAEDSLPDDVKKAVASFLYVPEDDSVALALYAPLAEPGRLEVKAVPAHPTAEWVAELTRQGAHGLLSLALDSNNRPAPFVVPGGRFNEMYGWDSYFITWGLLQDDAQLPLAEAMVSHQIYEIARYGKVLNANRTYYLTRSQPPFLTSLLRQVAAQRQGLTSQQRAPSVRAFGAAAALRPSAWLDRGMRAARLEYKTVWSAPPHLTPLCDGEVCLARYYGEGRGQPPEVEPGHFQGMYQRHAVEHGHCAGPVAAGGAERDLELRQLQACSLALEAAYTTGGLVDAELDAFFVQDRCVRESGHDTSFRWYVDGQERCADYATVDLNALLFKYEIDFAQSYAEAGAEAEVARWCGRAKTRARLMQRYLWSEEAGLFVDFDYLRGARSHYPAATTLYPLWASPQNVCGARLLDEAKARRLVERSLALLEAPGGLMATAPPAPAGSEAEARDQQLERQWEAPNGWAPHQMLAWSGLRQWGFEREAQRLAYRWLHMIASSAARYHGTVPEKFDVVARSHRVFAEYGNVNTDFSYIAQEGFGWMNASFLVGLEHLTPQQREALAKLMAPEVVFAEAEGGARER